MDLNELCKKTYCDGLRTYNIDMLIHKLYWDKKYGLNAHLNHQKYIINFLRKFKETDIKTLLRLERQYDFRSYLNGNKALMSSILINSQFILYDFLLSNYNISEDINIKIDSIIIFFKLLRMDMNYIPIEELDALKHILYLLKNHYSDFEMFNNKWWGTFINKYEDCLYIAQGKEWFSEPIIFDKIIMNYGMDFFEEYFKNTNSYYNEFGNWEYCPEFNNYNNNVNIQFIYNIKSFYL